jgi:2'-5' RNA ligase
MRLFLAINIPGELRRTLSDAVQPLRDLAPDIRWTSELKLHLTIKFLGEQEDSRLPAIEDAMRSTAAQHASTAVTINGFGAFPNTRRPRVVWIGVEHSPRLELLAHDLECAFETIGFEAEARAFRPHITLGRVRESLGLEQARSLARAARRMDFEESLPVESVDLMRSVAGAGGSTYQLIASVPLSRGSR